MRILSVLFTVLLCIAVPFPVAAQVTLDPEQQAAMQAAAMQQSRPAEFVLTHRTELGLTAPQVATLETLVVAQRDSARARQMRAMERIRTYAANPALAAAVSWSGPVDAAALRDAMCQQTTSQVEVVLGIASDRRVVASVLTPAQVAQLPRMQSEDMQKAMRRP